MQPASSPLAELAGDPERGDDQHRRPPGCVLRWSRSTRRATLRGRLGASVGGGARGVIWHGRSSEVGHRAHLMRPRARSAARTRQKPTPPATMPRASRRARTTGAVPAALSTSEAEDRADDDGSRRGGHRDQRGRDRAAQRLVGRSRHRPSTRSLLGATSGATTRAGPPGAGDCAEVPQRDGADGRRQPSGVRRLGGVGGVGRHGRRPSLRQRVGLPGVLVKTSTKSGGLGNRVLQRAAHGPVTASVRSGALAVEQRGPAGPRGRTKVSATVTPAIDAPARPTSAGRCRGWPAPSRRRSAPAHSHMISTARRWEWPISSSRWCRCCLSGRERRPAGAGAADDGEHQVGERHDQDRRPAAGSAAASAAGSPASPPAPWLMSSAENCRSASARSPRAPARSASSRCRP